MNGVDRACNNTMMLLGMNVVDQACNNTMMLLGMNVVGCVLVVVWAAATTFGLTTILNRNDKIKVL